MFYSVRKSGKYVGVIAGFPKTTGAWCKKLKYEHIDIRRSLLQALQKQIYEGRNTGVSDPLRKLVYKRSETGSFTKPVAKPVGDGQKINIVHYIGIAADEPKRIERHIEKPDMILPLVQIGWDEALCGLEAKYMDMLSPTYTDGSLRDGCWFCHNQSIGQLRKLRHEYPNLWALLLKWDSDSPVTFHADGRTVRDFDRRFKAEDDGLIDPNKRFRWKMIEEECNT